MATSSRASQLVLYLKNNTSNCTEERIFFGLFIAEDLFNCSISKYERESSPKTLIGVSVLDLERKNRSNEYTMTLTPPYGMPCPAGCSYDSSKKNCFCDDLSLFDVEKQIEQLFSTSRIKDLLDFGSLESWKFDDDFIFYAVMVIFILATYSTIWIALSLKDYDIVEKQSSLNTWLTRWKITFVVIASDFFYL